MSGSEGAEPDVCAHTHSRVVTARLKRALLLRLGLFVTRHGDPNLVVSFSATSQSTSAFEFLERCGDHLVVTPEFPKDLLSGLGYCTVGENRFFQDLLEPRARGLVGALGEFDVPAPQVPSVVIGLANYWRVSARPAKFF